MPAGRVYRCGEFTIDAANRRLLHGDGELPLEPRVFAVIVHLLEHAGSLVARNELLDAIWGHRYVTPSTLNRTIALARRAFGDESSEPRYIQTVHGAGYRYVGPVELQAEQQPRARFGPPAAARLPHRTRALIGREDDLAQLGALLAGHRSVTVLGTGGMGKTQCALEAARRAATAFPDGAWFFDLTPCVHVDELVQAIGSSLAIQNASGDELLHRIIETFAERRALLLLDNCDRIADAVGEVLVRLLGATRELAVLATSQVPLDYAGELLLRLPPLRLPADDAAAQLAPAALAEVPAVAMLLASVQLTRPGFRLERDNADALVQICRRLDGMPLALELAAARFTMLSPPQVLERLEQRFGFLASSNSGRERRHQSLRTVLAWSHALLSPAEQQLLDACGCFVHSWSVELFLGLARELGHEPDVAIDLLSGLVDHGLVSVIEGLSPPRYRLLETVREYSLERLAAAEAPVRQAHLRLMVDHCERFHADMVAGRAGARFVQFTQDRGNVGAALEIALQQGETEAALRIVGALVLHAKGLGDYTRIAEWSRRVLDASADDDSLPRARALLTAGVMDMHLDPTGQCTGRYLPEAARIAHAHGDRWTEAYAMGYHAMSLANSGKPGKAIAPARGCAEFAEALDDDILLGLAALASGWIALVRGQLEEVVALLAPVRSLGTDLHQHSFVEMYLGLSRYLQGQPQLAARHMLSNAELCVALGNRRGVAGSIEGCAYLATDRRASQEGARLLAAAEGIRQRTGMGVFNFWREPQARSRAALDLALGGGFQQALEDGARMREEDATNLALSLLREYAAPAGQASANSD